MANRDLLISMIDAIFRSRAASIPVSFVQGLFPSVCWNLDVAPVIGASLPSQPTRIDADAGRPVIDTGDDHRAATALTFALPMIAAAWSSLIESDIIASLLP